MKVAILQPAYLPWLGFFDLMDQVDSFVLLDNVQFEKRSWQQRNRIKSPAGLLWLTVPVVSRGRFEQKICEVEIENREFWRDHLRSIEMNYKRASYFQQYFEECREVMSDSGNGRLVELTCTLIGWLAAKLGVTTPVMGASRLQASGKRTELLRNLCLELNCDEYVSPLGSAGYLLEELHVMTNSRVTVTFQNYAHPEYRQLFPPFAPYASSLDLLFNAGPHALEIVRSGRRDALSPEQVAVQLSKGAVHR